MSYDGKFMMDVYFQYDNGTPIREKFHFGQLPIMLMASNCDIQLFLWSFYEFGENILFFYVFIFFMEHARCPKLYPKLGTGCLCGII